MCLSLAEYTVWLCVRALHSLLCSFEIDRGVVTAHLECHGLDSGRPWGLLQCERATSDNLSSSVSDDSPPAVQPQSLVAFETWCGSPAFRAYQKHNALPWCEATEAFPLFIFLACFFYSSKGWRLRSTGRMVKATASSLHWECGLCEAVCVSRDWEEEEGGGRGRVRICRHRHRWNSLPPLAQTWLSMSDLL